MSVTTSFAQSNTEAQIKGLSQKRVQWLIYKDINVKESTGKDFGDTAVLVGRGLLVLL